MQKINTLITSYGMSGSVFHGPLLHAHPSFHWVGAVERTSDKVRLRFPDVHVFRSLQQALETLRPELVVVNTPPECHGSEIRLALEAGCHVLVEKPFSTDLEEARALVRLASKQQKVLTAFQNRRWDSDFLTLQAVLTDPRLGDWVYLESHFDRYRPEVDPNSWKEQPHPGSGLVWNLGPHLIDQILCLFGPPDSLRATVLKQRTGSRVDDAFSIQITYGQKLVELRSTYLAPDNRLKYRLHGTLATYQKFGMDVQEAQLKAGMFPGDKAYGQEPESQTGNLIFPDGTETPFPNQLGQYQEFYSRLAGSIREGKPAPVSTADMLLLTELIQAVYQSAGNGETWPFLA